ncbi:peroxisome biogenesis factor 2 isoform X1 [Macrosteles quadrilineatus]|uniref:peroxisome biogenesis factor 2 isoform X1 n=2 Tax=Macrosteles quadrilineatus TaxID=74068 RepID=UPI0023E1E022|nr:peroxisome biogenesis factor 2 isoform X1 [Macrosteles quadrilineatus]XP_054278235.1 peroxisome biogenesis factor 2 isoform X1 [Macrosteles quadrilineatus]XP_054278236.1 peroxisome biogenesis factor 2 isoform X1 [Macrosteles quadrilineatus]XP_054278237.1 peroxisome biogenesis factor 2 isoform X1 [Macrosteles quadrilineatus]XP_054278238.1 peroxisome biogenesis factor 2 isoform X1 [Macrosteles quadrilineatus]XP_054278239.1 peroxisome biogenesis factor 2 isoform X1 [Macrosteles quadrilineatus]
MPENPSTRVTALDAIDLDSEIQRILKDQLLKIVHILSPPWARWEPELDLFLRLILWKLSVYEAGATFGQQLLSIKYNSGLTRRKSVAWAALAFGVGYLHKRSSELTNAVAPEHKDKVREWLGRLEAGVQVARMLNLLMFLREGQFPDLVDRIVAVKPVAATPANRIVGYSYMTRELLWHGFIECIVFLLPLVNFSALQRSFRRLSGLGRPKTAQQGSLVYTTATRCAVCQLPPTLPHQMGCGHAFCYYCLLLQFKEMNGKVGGGAAAEWGKSHSLSHFHSSVSLSRTNATRRTLSKRPTYNSSIVKSDGRCKV